MFQQALIKVISSCLYLGYSPIIPGTAGSLGGLAIYLLVRDNSALYLISMVSIIALGFGVCGKAERIFGERDSGKIVIDELSGILVAFLAIPFNLSYLIIGFLLYRSLDVIKPYPLKRLERLPGSLGIMLDDIFAGLYTNFILRLIILIIKIF